MLFHSEEDGDDLSKVAKELYNEKELSQRSNVSTLWSDERIDASYPIHIAELLLEANKANKAKNSALIPPIPKLSRSSDNSDIGLVKDFNLSASTVRSAMLGEKYPHVFFHLYLDWKMMLPKTSGLNAKSLLPNIEEIIKEGDFAGICLTVKGYENAAEKGKFEYIESFVTELTSLAEYYYLPVILPRSKWYGLKLFDCSINCFGSLFNGKSLYTKRTKGFMKSVGEDGKKIDTHLEYGYTYIINECNELDYNDTKKYVERNKGFPDVGHLPKEVKEDYWNNSRLFRMHVSKPRRLSHMEESRYIRKGRKDNVINPATRYLERSSNPFFGVKS